MNTATATQTAQATYTKLKDGSWGVRVSGRACPGASVTVTKRDGSSKVETVGSVLWTGVAKDGREASLVTLAQSARPARSSRRYGSGHGSAASVPGYSSYCTDNDYCRCYDCAS